MSGTTPRLGLVTLVDADLARVALNTHWNTNATKLDDAATAGSNLLTNPGYELWQRGAGPFTAAYAADRWEVVTAGGSTASVTREGTLVDAPSLYAAGVAYTHAGSGQVQLRQKLEALAQLRGRTLTFAVRVRSSATGTVRLLLNDGSTLTFSGYNATTAYETLSLTVAVPAGATALYAAVRADVASCTFYADNATLAVGATAMPYVPLHPAEEWDRCLRYYEVHGGVASGPPSIFGYNTAANSVSANMTFAARKPITPTLTRLGSWSVNNCAQPSLVSSLEGYLMYTAATATGTLSVTPSGPTTTIVAEANP